MLFSKTITALALVASVYAAPANNVKGKGGKGGATNTNSAAASSSSTAAVSDAGGAVDTGSVTQPSSNANVADSSLTLSANAVQTGSENDGQFGVLMLKPDKHCH